MCCAGNIITIERCHWKHSAKALISGWKDEPEVETDTLLLILLNLWVSSRAEAALPLLHPSSCSC